ncbi:MAG: hypothetical protein ACXVCX_19740, partial [Ktedonobacterales bacterium]
EIEEYSRLLQAAGFEDVSVEITRRYTVEQAGLDTSTLPEGWEAGDGKLASAFVRATKPVSAKGAALPVMVTDATSSAKTASGGCCGGSGCCG